MKFLYLTLSLLGSMSFKINAQSVLENKSINLEKDAVNNKFIVSQGDDNRTKFLSSNNYVGYELVWPNLKKGWKNNGPWITLNAQASFVRAGIGFGNAYNVKDDEGVKRYGNYKFIGVFYNHPFHLLKNLFVVEPEIGLDFISAQFKDDITKAPNSAGFGITPGIGLKFGPVKIVGKYTTSFAYSIDKSNAWSGGMNYSSVGLFFETGWGLLNPRKIKSKGLITTVSETREFIGTYLDGSFVAPQLVNVYRETTNYFDHEVKSVVHDIRPFWFIAPKFNSSQMIDQNNSQTILYGGELGARASFFGTELFYNTGNSGFKSPIDEQTLIDQYGFAPDLSGSIQSSSYGGKLGIEAIGLLTKIFVHSHEDKRIYHATRYCRFLISYGIGSTQFTGKPKYSLESGEQQLADFFSIRPDLKPTNSLIPGLVDKANFTTFSMRLEVGVVAVGYENNKYKNSTFANGKSIFISYMIPPGRVVRKVKTLLVAKRVIRERKIGNKTK